MNIRDEQIRLDFRSWALRHVAAQHAAGLPLLNSVKSWSSKKILLFLKRLSPSDQRQILDACVARAFGDTPSVPDLENISKLRKALLEPNGEIAPASLNRRKLREVAIVR